MERIITYTIGKDASGWSLLKFLKEKHYSKTVITQLKQTENGICIDQKWTYVTHILQEGETLTVKLIDPCCKQDKILPIELPISVIYEDEDLLVINKPANLPIHPSLGHFEHTLANAVCYYALQKQENYPYRCVNRLDRDTSGLTIIAKNAYSSCILYEQMRNRKIQRTYYAIVQGILPEHGTIHAPIARKENSIIERTVDPVTGQNAITHYETLACKEDLSFVKLWLETGRTHQIRVHMQHIGHPLIGDFLYNPKDSRMKRQALHAGNLTFFHPVNGQLLQFTAPLPEDMLQFFDWIIS